VTGRKIDIGIYDVIAFYPESLSPVSSAEGTLVARAAHGYLQQYAVGLAGRADNVSFVVHENQSSIFMES
jgi:hypothetical protein